MRNFSAANKYISSHGLKFNSSKTTCTTFGTKHLTPLPTWHICHNILTETKQVTYLSTVSGAPNREGLGGESQPPLNFGWWG